MALTSALALLLAAGLAGCAAGPEMIDPREPAALSNVQEAVVISVQSVRLAGSNVGSNADALVAISAAREQVFVDVAGAVAGAVSGSGATRPSPPDNAVALQLRLKNGEQRSIVQAAGGEPLAPGDRVFIVATGGQLRVFKARSPAAP